MTKFKVGDKVRATKESNGQYGITTEQNGWTGVIISVDTDGEFEADTLTPKGECSYGGLDPKYFELLESKPTKNQRISTLEQKVEAMQAEIDTLKAAQKVTVSAPEILVKSEADIAKIAERFTKMLAKEKKQTPNERRKAIIDEAKAFVEDAISRNHPDAAEAGVWFTDNDGSIITDEAEFVVNDKKRTVVVLIKDYGKSNVYTKGIAKCAPGDVFNEHIGKAIALGRALGLDVERFEKAVQPSEVVVGMNVKNTGSAGGTFSITYVEDGELFIRNNDGTGPYFEDKYAVIVDDTEAQY